MSESEAGSTTWGSRLARRLQRVTSTGRMVPEIDGLRFVAVMAVLLYHLDGYVAVKARQGPADDSFLHALLGQGFLGVQVFFAISGLVLMLPQARRFLLGEPWPGLRAYYLRRLTRLEPPYLINLVVLATLLVLVKGESLVALFPHWLASAFYVHAPLYGQGSTVQPGAWSLEIEVQFYLLAPLFAQVFRIRRTWLRRLVIVGSALPPALVATIWPHREPAHGLGLAHQFHWFLAGFLLADLLAVEWRDARPGRGIWDALGLGAWILLPVTAASGVALEWLAPPLVFLALAAAFRGRWLRWLLRWTPLVIVGGACYSIYLWHELLISGLGRVTIAASASSSHALNVLVQVGLLVPSVLALSLVLYAIFERPFMEKEWPKRAWGWLRARA